MFAALIQTNLTNSTTMTIALIVLVLAVGLMVFLFARSSVQRREREAHVRERMSEMEREAQFAAAADRVPITRDPGYAALQIATLLREYTSMRTLAVYAGGASDPFLSDMLARADHEGVSPSDSGLPASVPASLLSQQSRPAVVSLSTIAGQSSRGAAVVDEPAPEKSEEVPNFPAVEGTAVEQTELSAAESFAAAPVEESQPSLRSADQPSTSRGPDSVMVLPWHGPFAWNGLIVTAVHAGIGTELLEPYRVPLERLTDRLAVALEFEHTDALSESHDERAERTTDFSRFLISCLDDPLPVDAIVREVTRLVRSDSAALWRIDGASGMVRMVAAHGLASSEFLPLPVGQGLPGSVAQSGAVLAIEDAPSDPRCIFPREARESGIVSYLGTPLAAQGETLGVIEAHCAHRRSWSESDQRALGSAASIIAELIKCTEARGTRLRVESAYLGLSESLQLLRSAGEVKEAVVEVLGHALAASRVVIVEFDDSGQPQPVNQEYRQPSAKSALGTTFSQSLAGAVAASENGQPIAISNSGEQSLAGPDTAAELGVRSELAAPIRVEGTTRGIVYVHQCDRVREWETDEIEFAERVVRQLSLSLSNLISLEAAFSDAKQARDDAQRVTALGSEAPARISELEQKLASIESALAQSRIAEEQARGMLARASALEAKARAEADVSRRGESEVKEQLERVQVEGKQAQGSAQQLLEINRLKSEFIVNAGHEMEASLQSVLGLAELLERGSYGNLTTEQREAVHGIYGWARRIKSDIDWLVEYGSARSRRLEPKDSSSAAT
jgi:GAF domain-containing protein